MAIVFDGDDERACPRERELESRCAANAPGTLGDGVARVRDEVYEDLNELLRHAEDGRETVLETVFDHATGALGENSGLTALGVLVDQLLDGGFGLVDTSITLGLAGGGGLSLGTLNGRRLVN
jgi:hypothetical protein